MAPRERLMGRRVHALALILIPCLSTLGCGGYFPLRRPTYPMFVHANQPAPAIALPSTALKDYADRIQKEHVTVAVRFLTADQTRAAFHVDLHQRHIQPVLVMIRNDSDAAYRFNKASVDKRYFPAGRVARFAQVSRIAMARQYLRWLAFLIPGVLFDTVVEPTTTIEFPGIQGAAQRPPRAHPEAVRAAFLRAEIPDGDVAPHRAQAGVVFIHPPRLGREFPITLVNVSTGQPLVFDAQTPPPRYTEVHDYSQPDDAVWEAVVNAARHLSAWRVASADKSHGVLTARTGMSVLCWSTATRLTVTVRALSDQAAQVPVESTLRRSDSAGYGAHNKTINGFFEALNTVLTKPTQTPPAPPAPKAASPDTSVGGSRQAPSAPAGYP